MSSKEWWKDTAIHMWRTYFTFINDGFDWDKLTNPEKRIYALCNHLYVQEFTSVDQGILKMYFSSRWGDDQYEVMELLGQRVLHSDMEMGLSEIPLGMYLYHLGTTDNRSRFNCVSNVRPENFGGSIVTLQPIELGSDGERPLSPEEAPHVTGEKISFEDLIQETVTEDEEMGGMEL
jgi:hypothetical protein